MYKYELKGKNFAEKVEINSKLNKLFEEHKDKLDNLPKEYLKNTLANATIVMYRGYYHLSGWSYKGVLDKVNIEPSIFKQFIELYQRPKVKTIN